MTSRQQDQMSQCRKSRIEPVQTPRTERKEMLPASGISWRGWVVAFGVLCVLGAPGRARSQQGPFVQCNQNYALCATATCFYLNGVAYCKCDKEVGASISIPFEFDNNTQNICTLLNDGLDNGYTVSTFSLPDQVTKKYAAQYKPSSGSPPPLALYTCPRGNSTGPYAQCDGGVCFDSTTGKEFPGVGAIGDNQILCSCPVTQPREFGPQLGYQITGPWQHADGTACGANGSPSDCCSSAFLSQFCFADYHPTIPTGAIIPVGAPTGAATALSILLGDIQPINTCFER